MQSGCLSTTEVHSSKSSVSNNLSYFTLDSPSNPDFSVQEPSGESVCQILNIQ